MILQYFASFRPSWDVFHVEEEADARVAEVSRPVLLVSMLLAATAWATFIAIHLVLRRKPELWILSAGWPVYYAIVLGFAYGMVSVSRRGGTGADVLPGQFRQFRIVLNRIYWMASQAAIIAFPLVALLIGVAVLIWGI